MENNSEIISSSKPIHVYISFRGDDDGTCGFVNELSAALQRKGLTTFGDDKKLEAAGDSINIPPHLLEAIQQSWIRIVVFSKNYASSLWCLEELSSVVPRFQYHIAGPSPVFHNVDPFFAEREERFEEDLDKLNRWRVAMKREAYGSGRYQVTEISRIISVLYDVDRSFVEHEETYSYGDLDDEVRGWREDMEEVARSCSSWDVRNNSRSQVITGIVKEVKAKVDTIFYAFFSFVGMESRVEELEKLLELGLDDVVRVIGICGMGGLGKSTIASVLYLKIFHSFDAFCFLPNVSRRLKHGDLSLQELLHRNTETENQEIRDILLGKEFLACKMLRNHTFLIVLDGVDLVQDLEELNLVEKFECFGGGSRIIITTRDEQVLQESEVDAIYRPELLTKEEAFSLFCSKAFQWGYPISGFEKMTHSVLEYANGLPLAVKILGSFLFGASVTEWRSFLGGEEIIPPYDIITVLRKSFDELDNMSKEMFLDIACFFTGKDINCVKEILHDCGFSVEEGFELLVKKSPVSISN